MPDGLLPIVGGLAAATFGAAWAHELTHHLAARAVGADAEIDWLNLSTAYDPSGVTRLEHYAIGLAPLVVGWVALTAVVLRFGWPRLSIWSLIGLLGWYVYTLRGGVSDYSIAARQPTH